MLGKVRHSAAHRQCHGLMTVTELSGVGGPSRTASLTGPPKRQLLAGAPDLADCNDHPTWLRPCVPSPETRSFKLRHEIPPKPPVVNFPHSPTICGMSVEDSTSSYYLALFRRGLFLGGGSLRNRLEEFAADFMIIQILLCKILIKSGVNTLVKPREPIRVDNANGLRGNHDWFLCAYVIMIVEH